MLFDRRSFGDLNRFATGRALQVVAQARLYVLNVNQHVITQRGQVGFVERGAQVFQGVVKCLQLVGIAFALSQALVEYDSGNF